MELNSFFSYCDSISASYAYSFYTKSDPIWTEHRQVLYANGVIPGLYREHDNRLLSLISKSCDHNELVRLLKREVTDYETSDLAQMAKERGYYKSPAPIKEPLLNWIADYNYCLAFPMCESKEELSSADNPEQILSYVYIYLSYKYWKRALDKKNQYDFKQPNTEALYKNVFDKSSEFKSWGLIPIDEKRKLYSTDDPVRIYDSSLNKTIFVNMPRPIAGILDELECKGYIKNLAVRSQDSNIYEGENHIGVIQEALERGRIFSWNVGLLPAVTKLCTEEFNDDCLWIKSEGNELTFEELCEDFHDDGDNVVTQMIHLQYEGNAISHLDHEYIFYDIESYTARKSDPKVKGKAKKRVKTLKIDNSAIPMDYSCKMYKDDNEISVPFIFFVLTNYFEHKDLLDEYFQKII